MCFVGFLQHHLRATQTNTARSIFMKENYVELRKENPEISSKELFPFFHQKFSKLSNKEKVLSVMGSFKMKDLSICFGVFSAVEEKWRQNFKLFCVSRQSMRRKLCVLVKNITKNRANTGNN